MTVFRLLRQDKSSPGMADQVFQSGLRAPSNKARTGPMRFGKREQSAPLSLANTNISVVARPIEPRRPSLGLAPPQPSRNRLTSPLSRSGNVEGKRKKEKEKRSFLFLSFSFFSLS